MVRLLILEGDIVTSLESEFTPHRSRTRSIRRVPRRAVFGGSTGGNRSRGGAELGTSTSGAYIESATGIREGARTGLASVVTAALFALSLFFIPLLEPLQSLQYAYAPALLIVRMLMLGAVTKIDFDLTELVPAFTTVVVMVFTFNIPNGLTAGLVLWPIVKALAGRAREVRAGAIVLAVLCAAYFAFGLPH